MEKLILIFYSFLVCSSCYNKTVYNKNWISISYLKCLENNLPCECQNKETHSLIELDLQGKYATIYEGIIYDPNTFNILENNDGSFQVFYTKSRPYKNDTIIIIGVLQISNDTLYYFDNQKIKYSFIKYGTPNDGIFAYDKEHVRLLDQAFKKRKYETLEKILDNDPIKCGCNKEFGINLLYTGSQIYILEQSKDSLFLYKWTNVPEGPDEINNIEKTLYKSFKWSTD